MSNSASRITVAKAALASGHYMLRRSDAGRSNGGAFQWAALGEWTEASDWTTRHACGEGLHGNHPTRGWAFWTSGADLDFCEIDEASGVIALGDKIKVRRARVLLRNDLSPLDGLSVGGDLYLRGCTGLTCLPDGLSVGGYLYLSGCTGLTCLPDGLSVGGDLYLRGCTTAIKDDATRRGLRWYEYEDIMSNLRIGRTGC